MHVTHAGLVEVGQLLEPHAGLADVGLRQAVDVSRSDVALLDHPLVAGAPRPLDHRARSTCWSIRVPDLQAQALAHENVVRLLDDRVTGNDAPRHLQGGLEEAERLLGYTVTRKDPSHPS